MNIITTIGDCNGVGFEVLIKSIINIDKKLSNKKNFEISIVGNKETMQEYSHYFGLPTHFENDGIFIKKKFCKVIECKSYSKVQFGEITKSAGKLASEALEIAAKKTLSKEYDAMVTMPVSKAALYITGWDFPGQTEMLAKRSNILKPLMILCTRTVRVALATIHIPLKEVSNNLFEQDLIDKIQIFHNSLLNDFKVKKPQIAVLGLNPHAGEDGSIGTEENTIIIPALKKCKGLGFDVQGPFAADGFFAHGSYKNYDGIFGMYHDQGLIPLKLLAEGAGVNFTAGLPIVRTSPDHGTAYNIAGKNIAENKSCEEAIEMAIRIAEARNK